MNGVVHNCARDCAGAEGGDASRYQVPFSVPRSDADIYLAVFKYLDRLFSLVQPRKLVYLAVDGVAPRAKMNQQRGRRFRAAFDRELEHERRMRTDAMYKAVEKRAFDSNCITPGTVFMTELTNALNYFVHKRVSEDAAWAKVEVILSGAEVPGEGEHKIMEYIRAMKLAHQIPPNTRHCVYGLDADLIMLSLVTHEPHFVLIREKVDFQALFRRRASSRLKSDLDVFEVNGFQLLSTGLLREYLAMDIGANGVSGEPFFDIERVVDDFVLFAMLVGNDFLPHLPSIDITEGALGTMLALYKRLLPRFGGYIVEQGAIVPDRFELFVLLLGLLEVDILSRRADLKGSEGRKPRVCALSDNEHEAIWGMKDSAGFIRPWNRSQLKHELRRVRDEVRCFNDPKNIKAEYYQTKFNIDISTKEGLSKLRKVCVSYTEGISWTLKYYFEGCASWRWFYPYHYAPFASDLMLVADLSQAVSFTRGIPFKPFEQLLSVLPPVSGWCLPKSYHHLMTRDSSPIRDKFPTDFELDMNGKRNEWEAVVLLPFINEKDLLSATMSIPASELTAAEKARNCHGSSLVYRRQSGPQASLSTVMSPFPNRLPDIMSEAAVEPLSLPFVLHGVPFPVTWTRGTHAAGSHPSVADLPTFSGIPFTSKILPLGVNIFGMVSRGLSVVVEQGVRKREDREFVGLNSAEDEHTLRRNVKQSILNRPLVPALRHVGASSNYSELKFQVGDRVWVNYPWRTVGIVESVQDKSKGRICQQNGESRVSEDVLNRQAFTTLSRAIVTNLLERSALRADDPQAVLGVRLIVEKDALTGVPTKFSRVNEHFLAEYVTKMNEEDMDGMSKAIVQHRKKGIRRAADVNPGDRVLSVGRGPLFGCLARVRDVRRDGHLLVSYSVRPSFAKEPAFAYRVVTKYKLSEQCYSAPRAAGLVNLPVAVLGSITGSIRVRVPDSKRDEIDIGLGIKYTGRGLVVPGYAKIVDGKSFMLTDAAVNLIAEYKRCFPDLFEALVKLVSESGNNKQKGGVPASRVLDATELFGKGPAAKDALTAAAAWVGSREIASLPLVASDAGVLSKDCIAELEREQLIAKDLQSDGMAQGDVDIRKCQAVIPRHLAATGHESLEMYNSLVGAGALPAVKEDASDIRLGDRVVNRVCTGVVPFGLRGTVVGIHSVCTGHENGSNASGPRQEVKNHREGRGAEVHRGAGSVYVEVVFDEGFVGGGNLNGRCSPCRGKAVSPSTLLLLRPDCDNPFYMRRYPQVANSFAVRHSAEVSMSLRRAQERERESTAIASAAVKSYIAAAKASIIGDQHESSSAEDAVAKAANRPRTDEEQHSIVSNGVPVAGQLDREREDLSFKMADLFSSANGASNGKTESYSSKAWREGASDYDENSGISDAHLVETRLKQMLNLQGAPNDDHNGSEGNDRHRRSSPTKDPNAVSSQNVHEVSRGRNRSKRSRAKASKEIQNNVQSDGSAGSAVAAQDIPESSSGYSDDDMLQLWKQLHES